MSDDDYPSLFRAANAASGKAQRQFVGAVGGNLLLLVSAAALSWAGRPNIGFAVAQALVLAASLGCVLYLAHRQPQKQWYGMRALSESVKTTTWRWMMRAEPFDGPDGSAKRELVASLTKTLKANRKISEGALDSSGAEVVTAAMDRVRGLPLSERKALYEGNRIAEQLAWYQAKATYNDQRANVWFALVIVLNALALVCAVARILYPASAGWPTDVLTAAAGATLAWVQTKRYQELAASYTLTAYEIGLIRATMPDDNDEKLFSAFVSDAENAFSREHTQWQARRDRD